MKELLIISDNAEFAHGLAQAAQRELKLAARAGKEAKTGDIVLSTGTKGDILVELPARLNDVLEQIEHFLQAPAALPSLAIGENWLLNIQQKTLNFLPEKQTIDLTDKEIQLLQCLIENMGKNISKEELLKNVWGIESALDTHTLETHIYRLRNKLRDASGDDGLIMASGGGYSITL